MSKRRSVDWKVILNGDVPASVPRESRTSPELARLLSATDELVALDDVDVIVRRAVELARHGIGLERVGVFLLDDSTNSMLGTWGTDLDGAVTDEHHVMYDLGEGDREVYRRAAAGVARWTVFEDCPIVVHLESETRVVGRGWVACTPILSPRRPLGTMFNDTGPDAAPLDEGKQAQAAVLCSLLGTILDLTRDQTDGAPRPQSLSTSPRHPMVLRAVQLLTKDPATSGRALGQHLGISASRLGRVFKSEMGMSLVEYRNRLRLDRFFALVEKGGGNLLEAALDAGFGSYAQFHRVFRAQYGRPPKEFLAANR